MRGETNITSVVMGGVQEELEDIKTHSKLSADLYKASGITSAYGSIVKIGNMVSINCGWYGNISGNAAILNVPDGYKPSENYSGGHMHKESGGWATGNCTINSAGKVFDSTTSNAKTEGVISLVYYVD